MTVRDPEGKKRSLLDSALLEFAANGLGARVEDIAAGAGCSAGLVYTYFGSKEALFDAVLDDITARMIDLLPMTGDDLASYAVGLFEAGTKAPEVDRFVAWYELQRSVEAGPRSSVEKAIADKIAAVGAALDAGVIASDLSASELVLAVHTIARMWAIQPRAVISAVGGNHKSQREAVRTAVEALITRPS